MIEPKVFYRKMEALISQIGNEPDVDILLPNTMRALEDTFGAELCFGRGHLYVEAEDAFVLHTPVRPNRLADRLPIDVLAVQLVLRHGSYIFSDPAVGAGLAGTGGDKPTTPFAFAVVRGPRRRWLFVYQLSAGWDQEQITFCMNAVRFSLNFKLRAEMVENELEQAAQIQQSLLPASLPTFAGFDIAVRTTSAEEVGGDWYDFLPLETAILGVGVGDASGHGLSAALLVRDVMTGLRMGVATQQQMLHMLRKLNTVIHRSAYSSRFVSLIYGELESNGNFVYANAGHPPALLVREDEVEQLDSTGMIIGPLEEIALDRAFKHVRPGDVLLLYTDGIVERQDGRGNEFGLDSLIGLVKSRRDETAQAIVDAVYEAATSFGDDAAWEDDATVVVIKRNKA